MPDERNPMRPPPWAWSRLASDVRQAELEGLTSFVEGLVEDYGDWLELPECWPRHQALRAELAFLWYWHRALSLDASDPSQGVRWHSSLRASALAWRALSSCRHEEESEMTKSLRRAWRDAASRYVAQALAESHRYTGSAVGSGRP